MKTSSGPTSPKSLQSLIDQFPSQWQDVRRELLPLIEKQDVPRLARRLQQAHKSLGTSSSKTAVAKARMTIMAIEHFSLAVATGETSGRVRFNLLNGLIVQRLLFSGKLKPKPVSLFWFNLLWPFVSQRNFLMPLVQDKGIYCFYSRRLIQGLAQLIGPRSCLELAAGNGVLTTFLRDAGVQISATDNYSWEHQIRYPDFVEKLEAEVALERLQPEAVICSWPPPGNRFERHVFQSASVKIYIVIGSRHAHASGDRDAYLNQTNFTMTRDPQLAACVLPPELESEILIFRRPA